MELLYGCWDCFAAKQLGTGAGSSNLSGFRWLYGSANSEARLVSRTQKLSAREEAAGLEARTWEERTFREVIHIHKSPGTPSDLPARDATNKDNCYFGVHLFRFPKRLLAASWHVV